MARCVYTRAKPVCSRARFRAAERPGGTASAEPVGLRSSITDRERSLRGHLTPRTQQRTQTVLGRGPLATPGHRLVPVSRPHSARLWPTCVLPAVYLQCPGQDGYRQPILPHPSHLVGPQKGLGRARPRNARSVPSPARPSSAPRTRQPTQEHTLPASEAGKAHGGSTHCGQPEPDPGSQGATIHTRCLARGSTGRRPHCPRLGAGVISTS